MQSIIFNLLKRLLKPLRRYTFIEKLISRLRKGRTIRSIIGKLYLSGTGIEVGALHSPLPVPPGVKVLYVDRYSEEGLKAHYPELASLKLVSIDIIDNGEKLEKIPRSSQDFIIANHFLEHCRNPLGTIETFVQKVKVGGVIYLAVPDKRFTFDKFRKITPFSHIRADYYGKNSDDPHYYEFALIDHKDVKKAKAAARELKRKDYSIHFHVWDFDAYLDFLIHAKKFFKDSFSIQAVLQNEAEVISVLRRER